MVHQSPLSLVSLGWPGFPSVLFRERRRRRFLERRSDDRRRRLVIRPDHAAGERQKRQCDSSEPKLRFSFRVSFLDLHALSLRERVGRIQDDLILRSKSGGDLNRRAIIVSDLHRD